MRVCVPVTHVECIYEQLYNVSMYVCTCVHTVHIYTQCVPLFILSPMRLIYQRVDDVEQQCKHCSHNAQEEIFGTVIIRTIRYAFLSAPCKPSMAVILFLLPCLGSSLSKSGPEEAPGGSALLPFCFFLQFLPYQRCLRLAETCVSFWDRARP